MAQGITARPRPFKACITPRSLGVVDIIEKEFEAATETFVKFEVVLSEEDKLFLEKYRTESQ